jgi:predicted nuclease of predicted toxin-antitoxin system
LFGFCCSEGKSYFGRLISFFRMKLLFDQNISFRICHYLADKDFDCFQVRSFGLENKSDIEIWKYAKSNDFIIVTFDFDFINFSNLYGHPPKVIWMKIGNSSTKKIADYLTTKTELIKDFAVSIAYQDISVLELTKN